MKNVVEGIFDKLFKKENWEFFFIVTKYKIY